MQRARALLMAADGVANTRIAASLGVTAVTVRAWRTRFAEKGLAKLGEVREGRGPKPSISVETGGGDRRGDPAFQTKGETHWSTRTMGQTVGGEQVHGAKDLARTGVWDCSRLLHDNGLLLASLGLFGVFFLGMIFAGAATYNQQQHEHGSRSG